MSHAENPDRPYVFRSVPHLWVFQDFTESRPDIALENDPESAAIIYYGLFCEAGIIQPPPKDCVPILRQILRCSCGTGIFRRNAHFCDECAGRAYAYVPLDEAKKRATTPNSKEPPKVKARSWRPPPAPKVRQTWKKKAK